MITLILNFDKKKRLLQAKEFSAVLQDRHSHSNRFFRIYVLPNVFGIPRLGLTVSKKINRHAHRRNSIKRIVREWFRLKQGMFPAIDMVVQARCTYQKKERLKFWEALHELNGLIKNQYSDETSLFKVARK